MNITKTVRKVPVNLDLERVGAAVDDHPTGARPGPKYDEEGAHDEVLQDIDITTPINHENFQATLARYPIVMINFFAPWCHWCQRLEPTWEAATKEVHDKYPEWDGRIRFAKVRPRPKGQNVRQGRALTPESVAALGKVCPVWAQAVFEPAWRMDGYHASTSVGRIPPPGTASHRLPLTRLAPRTCAGGLHAGG